ncbi:MAG: serine/threonine-protein kinase PknK, partial [Planctomycetes bacterium]|nr:serine/threonine-protein kinase PknK [Planctomycetota bacterium]
MAVPTPGSLAGPYRLDAQIGAGGMGTVWLATVEGAVPGLPVGERVALKIVHPHLVVESDVFERFVREAELGRAIRHQNVVRTLDAGMDVTDDGLLVYLAMEYVVGRTLSALRSDDGLVAEGFVRRIAREVARGLAAIHERGVVHGDVKPENVLLTRDEVVKVMDLGLARLRDRSLRNAVGTGFSGSLLYAAPEQFSRGQDDVDGRLDLFALGVTIYELAAGRHPWKQAGDSVFVPRQLEVDAPRLRQVRPDVSPFLDAVVHAMIQRAPDRRIRSAAELAAILASAEDGPWFRSRGAVEHGTGPAVVRAARLHGREEEMAELWRLARSLQEGGGASVLLEGEPGAGKSRLVGEFAEAAAARGMTGCVIRRAFGPGRDGADVVAGLDDPPRCALIVVEDVDHASASGWNAAAGLARRACTAGCLVILTASEPTPLVRREMLDDFVVRIRLGPLTDAAVADIAGDVLLAGRPAPALVQFLAVASGRHAGAVIAWTRSLLAARALRSGPDAAWSPDAEAWAVPVPDEVIAWGRSAFRGTPADDCELIEACACAGLEFDPSLVGAVVGQAPRDVEARLGVMARRGLVVRAAGDRWAFGSRPFFEAVRAGVSESLRLEYARAFAETLMTRERRDGRDSAELLLHARFAGALGLVSREDVCCGLAYLDSRGMHAEVLAIAESLPASGSDAATAREIALRRGLALLALGRTSDGADAIRAAATLLPRGESSPYGSSRSTRDGRFVIERDHRVRRSAGPRISPP